MVEGAGGGAGGGGRGWGLWVGGNWMRLVVRNLIAGTGLVPGEGVALGHMQGSPQWSVELTANAPVSRELRWAAASPYLY